MSSLTAQRTCFQCGADISGRRRGARFCSPRCRALNSRIARILRGEQPDGYTSIDQYLGLRRDALPSPDVWPVMYPQRRATRDRIGRGLALLSDAGFAECSLSQWSEDDLRCRWCDTLTTPGERFCSAGCGIEAVEQHLMWAARPAVIAAAGGKCLECDAPAREVHHIRPCIGAGKLPGCIHHASNLQPLCHDHHRSAHARLGAGGSVS